MSQPSLDLYKGTLDVLVLKTLSWGPAHGYGVTRALEQLTEGALQIEEGALYPALHRLERRGWIQAEWGLSANNRRAKYYELTGEGRRQLHDRASSWSRFAEAMGKVLSAEERPSEIS